MKEKNISLNGRYEILKEVKDILQSDKNMNNNCISLCDMVNVLKDKCNLDINKIMFEYKTKMDSRIKNEIGYEGWIYGFNFEKKLLQIGVKPFGDSAYYDIWFSKKDDDLYVVSSDTCHSNEILYAVGDILSELYDKLIKTYSFNYLSHYEIESVNSSFKVLISKTGVDILFIKRNLFGKVIDKFELRYLINCSKYDFYCNSNEVMSTLKGKEDEIFKSIFVNILDCPRWIRTDLTKYRLKQLGDYNLLNSESIEYDKDTYKKNNDIKRKIKSIVNRK